ncbi:MAG: hypothetical protein HYY93_01675 [Planctomycetes bacterium]|nr:hypothetical protein [Planctomycetota bacterium]
MTNLAGYSAARLLFLCRHRREEQYQVAWELAFGGLMRSVCKCLILLILAVGGGVAVEVFTRRAEAVADPAQMQEAKVAIIREMRQRLTSEQRTALLHSPEFAELRDEARQILSEIREAK